ncbi:MAG TPA: hypothetical protein VJT33_17855 [bacterium]|nr:hypothetical protein [bacterium]
MSRPLSIPLRASPIAALFATLVLCLVTALPASADLTVKGDAAAWREVVAAYQKLSALPGYRMRTTMPQGSMVVEVAPAGKAMHSTVESSSGGAEFIIVGGQSRMRITAAGAPAGWRCMNVPRMPNVSDPTAIQGTVDVARAPDAAIDGQPMHVYLYTIESSAGGAMAAAGPVKTTLYVGSDNGLPRRVAVATTRGDQALDYYDYGAAIQITLPPCAPGS